MEKIVVIVVLLFVAVALVFAIRKKSLIRFLIELVTEPVEEEQAPAEQEEAGAGFFVTNTGTIVQPHLLIEILNDDGSVFFRHPVMKQDMRNEAGRVIGLLINPAGSDAKGLALHGKRRANGSFDESHLATCAALHIPVGAVRIGYDEKGFFGEVSDRDVRVFEYNGAYKRLCYGDQFEIDPEGAETKLLIGNLWLRFTVPAIPAFPGAKAFSGRASAGIGNEAEWQSSFSRRPFPKRH